jgi:hypothetical protein
VKIWHSFILHHALLLGMWNDCKQNQLVYSNQALPLPLTIHCCIAAWGVIIFLGIAGAAIAIAGGAGGASGQNHTRNLPTRNLPHPLLKPMLKPHLTPQNELQAILAASAKRRTARTLDNLVTLVATYFLVAGPTPTSSLLE